MAHELKSKCTYYCDDPLLKKYFWNQELSNHEIERKNSLNLLIENFCNKCSFDKKNFNLRIGYLDGFGFYEFFDVDRGYYYLLPLGDDIDDLFRRIVLNRLSNIFQDEECKNRDTIKKVFHNKFGECEYNSQWYTLVRSIEVLKEYYDGALPQEIIAYFESYANGSKWNKKTGIYFKYDGSQLVIDDKFENTGKSLLQKIKKMFGKRSL